MKKLNPPAAGRNEYYAKTREVWRKWLAKNHERCESVWLILYNKASKISSPNYAEAVEEALCFGWIDSKANKRDSQSRIQYFARRNPKSKWSGLNKERVKKLMKAGLMQKAGLEMVKLAKKSGTWTALDEVEALKIPEDLSTAISHNKRAHINFEAFPPSSRKIILYWILDAKRTETRKKRIRETVALAARNIRAHHYPT